MTNRDRILIGALACLVAVAGFWFLALKPKRADAAAATARVAEAQTKLTAANQALASATSARASFQTDYAIAARLGKAVPDDDDAGRQGRGTGRRTCGRTGGAGRGRGRRRGRRGA